jgi:Ca2+-binding EF-hand superfamily protein
MELYLFLLGLGMAALISQHSVTGGECEYRKETQEDFEDLDRDRDGSVSFDEVMYKHYDRFQTNTKTQNCVSKEDFHFPDLFDALDVNGDGKYCPDDGRLAAVDTYTRIFKEMDTNSDGVLNGEELYIYKSGDTGDSESSDRKGFNKVDQNKDGKVTREEMLGQLVTPESSYPDSERRRAEGKFTFTDVNGDGALDFPEYCHLVTSTQEERDAWGRRLEFDHADVNKDGKITMEEVVSLSVSPTETNCTRKDDWIGSPASFERKDANSDGLLCPDEARVAMEAEARPYFSSMDDNNDGFVDWNEYQHFAT